MRIIHRLVLTTLTMSALAACDRTVPKKPTAPTADKTPNKTTGGLRLISQDEGTPGFTVDDGPGYSMLRYTVTNGTTTAPPTIPGVYLFKDVSINGGAVIESCNKKVDCLEAGLFNPTMDGSIVFQPTQAMIDGLALSLAGHPMISFKLMAGDAPEPTAEHPLTQPAGLRKLAARCAEGASTDADCVRRARAFTPSSGPGVLAVTSTKPDGSYKVDTVIPITVTFSGVVLVTGNPRIKLKTGESTDRFAGYTGGSGTKILSFDYTVSPGDTSSDLDYASTEALGLNGGSIKDSSAHEARLTLKAPGSPGSIAYGKVLVIDTTAPTVVFTAVAVANPGVTRTPTILGTGSEVSTVTLYLDAACSGPVTSTPTENWAFASPGIVLSYPVGFKSVNTVIYGRAVDVAGNVSACTSLVSYTHAPTKMEKPTANLAAGLYNRAITPIFTKDSRSLQVAVSTTGSAPVCALLSYSPAAIMADTTFEVVSCPTDDTQDVSDVLTVAYTFNIITPLGVVAHPNVDGYPTILWDTSSAFDLQKEAEINIFEPDYWIDHFSWHNRPSSPSPLAAGRVVTKKPIDYSWFGSAAQVYSADVFAMSISSVFCPGGYCADTHPAHSVKLGSYKKELPASFASSDMADIWAGIMTEVDHVSAECASDPCVYFSSDSMIVYQIHLNSRTWKQIAHTYYSQPIQAMVFDPSTKRLIIGGYFESFFNSAWGAAPS